MSGIVGRLIGGSEKLISIVVKVEDLKIGLCSTPSAKSALICRSLKNLEVKGGVGLRWLWVASRTIGRKNPKMSNLISHLFVGSFSSVSNTLSFLRYVLGSSGGKVASLWDVLTRMGCEGSPGEMSGLGTLFLSCDMLKDFTHSSRNSFKL